MARLYPARLFDEFHRTGLQRFHIPCLDCRSIVGIVTLDIAVEAFNKLLVRDGVGWRKQPCGRDDRTPGQLFALSHCS